MQRVFLGIPLPSEISDQLLDYLRQHDSRLALHKIHYLKNDQLHITIHFFGNVDEQNLLPLRNQLCLALATSVAFNCQLTQIANFPKPSSHIIACYVHLSQPLAELYAKVQSIIKTAGFLGENRPYLPHVTLARIGHRDRISLVPLCLREIEFLATELILYESRPSSKGSEYIPLQRFPFIKELS